MNTLRSKLSNQKLTIRTATQELEISQLRDALNHEHYLKAGRPAGHVLWQGIYRNNLEEGTQQLVAVLCWAGAAKSLKPRDQWIGWDRVTCANRLKLVVQLRRFIVLEIAREPNLASQSLALSLRTLACEWEKVHEYQPLLAESFHDPKIHTGTLYKVTNWLPLGLTKGFKRHRADFYQDMKSPKQLWVRPLKKQAPYLLCQPHALPAQHQKGISEATAGARCALTTKQLRSLNDIFWELADPRSPKTRRHPLGAMLTLFCYGLLCGASNVKSIWKKCGALNEQQRKAVGLTRRHKGSGRLMMPGYDALNDLINRIDEKELSSILNKWLAEHSDQLPKSLALDGKDLGGNGKLGAIVSLVHHSNGQPLAMQTYSGAKDDCELPVSKRLLENEQLDLNNAVVTGDALLAQKN